MTRLAAWLWREWDWTSVFLVAPVLLFPDVVPAATAGVLALFAVAFLVHARGSRSGLGFRSPYSWPLALLVVMVLVGAWISPYPDLTRPKLAGMALGVLTLRAVMRSVTTRRRVLAAVALYLVVGAALLSPGLLNTRLSPKFLGPETSQTLVPKLGWTLPGTESDQGVNPNALGGTTLFFLPLLLHVCVAMPRLGRELDVLVPRLPLRRLLVPAGLVLSVLFFVSLLVLSQSRTSWVSAAVACAGVVVILSPRIRASVLGVAAAAVLVAAVLGAPRVMHGAGTLVADVADLAFGIGASVRLPSSTDYSIRRGLHAEAFAQIRRAPVAGVGLNAFRRRAIDSPLLPGTRVRSDVAHAHNVFLQTALDTGLPGLVAYLALLFTATALAWRVWNGGDLLLSHLAAGLWLALLAVHVFGLADAIVLGAKVGLFMWWNLGLLAALHALAARGVGGEPAGAPAGGGGPTALSIEGRA